MKVLAIFTCYNRRELTRQSMELLGQNKNVTFDYVIVNDGSTDGTDEMLAAMPYEIDLINGDGGLFWNRGMYEAIEHAKKAHPDYEYYMLMNDDTKFVPGKAVFLSASVLASSNFFCASVTAFARLL